MARDRMPLTIGLRLDVLDNEGIWNTGRIADVAKDEDKDDELVEIKYDGWGDEYNEWVAVSEQRLAPLHMFTIVKKCWAKLNKWPWWPAFVVLRAPTKRGAMEALEAETKVYVEFFDAFEEDKRSRCWMQRKSVVSFADNFEERAAKNVGKNFHKFVESTQRALASSSPLLFAGAGTLPIEYSSKSPLSLVAHKQKLGDKEWFAAYKAFSDRYSELYGFEGAKNGASRAAKKARTEVDEDAEVAEGAGYGEESEEVEEAEEEEASAEEEEEAAESARSRRTARGAAQKRKLPARASTRRNAQKRVKAIEQLLQSAPAVSGRLELERSTAAIARAAVKIEQDLPRQASDASSYKLETPIVLTLEDDDDEDDVMPAARAGAVIVTAAKCSDFDPVATSAATAASSSNLSEPDFELPSSADWDYPMESQIYVIPEAPSGSEPLRSTPAPAGAATPTRVSGTPIRNLFGTTSPATPVHRRKAPRVIPLHLDLSSAVPVRDEQQQPTFSTAAGPESGRVDGDERDDDAHFWTGGSRYEVDNEPWKIKSWFIRGLKQKLLQQHQQHE